MRIFMFILKAVNMVHEWTIELENLADYSYIVQEINVLCWCLLVHPTEHINIK